MLCVNPQRNASKSRGSGSVEESGDLMGVDHIRFHPREFTTQSIDQARRESRRFVHTRERATQLLKTISESARPFETNDVGLLPDSPRLSNLINHVALKAPHIHRDHHMSYAQRPVGHTMRKLG
jgi:hypothetical protein